MTLNVKWSQYIISEDDNENYGTLIKWRIAENYGILRKNISYVHRLKKFTVMSYNTSSGANHNFTHNGLVIISEFERKLLFLIVYKVKVTISN